jgi:peroxiredoxin
MKNTFLLSAAIGTLAFGVVSCNNSGTTTPAGPHYTIDMEIANSSMDSAFIYSLGADGWDLVDSVKGDSGKFHFEGSVNGAEYLAIGDKKRTYAVRLLADNNPITIKGNFEEPGSETITGSKVNEEHLAIEDSLSIFQIQLQSIVDRYNAAETVDDTAAMSELEIEYYASSELKDKWLIGWIKNNPKSYVAQFYIVNPLMYSLETPELRELFDNISPEVAGSNMYNMIGSKLEVLEASAVGKPAPDFTMNDTTGAPQTLSSHFGTYLLIDFWASWCGPCRADNPEMVDIYNKYHDKGYNVIGVSLDKKKDRWIQAIGDDNLNWAHVSDLEGWSNAAAKLYGVSSIPHTVLIDPNGVIIARGLRTAGLEEKLAELFAAEVQ